jgi:hypothetical protein
VREDNLQLHDGLAMSASPSRAQMCPSATPSACCSLTATNPSHSPTNPSTACLCATVTIGKQFRLRLLLTSLMNKPAVTQFNQTYTISCGGATALRGPTPTQCWGFEFTLRHTTHSTTPLDEGSAHRIDLHLKTHSTHNRQTSMSPGGTRTRYPSKRTAADPSPRPSGHRDRQQ